MSPRIQIHPKKKSTMSRLKRKPEETLQQWVDRVSIKKPQLDETTWAAIILIGLCFLAILLIEIFA